MSLTCDCGAVGYWSRHDRECALVDLRKRPRIECNICGEEDQPQAKEQWFIDHDWCAHCEDNYEPPDDDGEAFRGGEAAAYDAGCQDRIQRELK